VTRERPGGDHGHARSSLLSSEDWWSVWLGLAIFFLSLGTLGGVDLLGWGAKTAVWLTPGGAVKPVSPAYAGLPGIVSVVATYAFMLALTSVGAHFLGLRLKRFLGGFTVVFWSRTPAGSWATTATSRPRPTS